MKSIKTLHISFNLPIYHREIPRWRGAFLEMGAWEDDHFHNHDGERFFHYRYPFIQYRVMKNGYAGIFAIGEGVERLQKVLTNNAWTINWKGTPRRLVVEELDMREEHIDILAHQKAYKVYKWLALNQKNHEKWLRCKNLVQRAELLEGILYGHLFRFCKNIDFDLQSQLVVNLQNIKQVDLVKSHKVNVLAFNALYDTNLDLPESIGIGKAVSHGFGWQVPAESSTNVKGRSRRNVKRGKKSAILR